MILRDPPGGKSYVSYTNVATTINIASTEEENELREGVGFGIKTVVEAHADSCIGGGVGALVLICNKAFEVAGYPGTERNTKWGAQWFQSYSESNQITVTWSYETSQDPMLAGPLSDVFVVPNFNVLYNKVTKITWDEVLCSANSSDTIEFDLKSDTSKPSFAFYSRWHIENVKLPELKDALDVVTDQTKRASLKQGIEGWESALLQDMNVVKSKSPAKLGDLFPYEENKKLLGLQLERADPLKNNLEKPNLSEISRLQYSGGGNIYSLTMALDSVLHTVSQRGSSRTIDGARTLDIEGKIFGIGVESTLSLNAWNTSSSTNSNEREESNSTEITVYLGDDNIGDEFVVEMYSDKKYGSIIFKTVAGRSSCPHEEKTAKVLDPRISLSSLPSPYVSPDDAITFEVEVSNLGVGPGKFLLTADDNSNDEGVELSFFNRPFQLDTNGKLKKTIQITRGPRLYQYRPIDLVFREACFASTFDTQPLQWYFPVANQNISLANVQSPEGSYLQFMEPCPSVEWAGELKRDEGFLVNSVSETVEKLQVIIRNPNYQEGKLVDNKRLQSIQLLYRRKEDTQWKIASSSEPPSSNLDFFLLGKEDNYGFIANLNWLLDGVVEGTYEVIVECRCINSGGPPDLDISRTSSISGVYDVTPPKLFGKPLPLSDELLLGEELVFVFTEPLQCSKPFGFDVKMQIFSNPKLILNASDLQVICQDNRISIQIDLEKVDIAKIIGKTLIVEVGSIGKNTVLQDLSENALAENVKVNKTIANIDLSQASTSFSVSLENFNCSDRESDVLNLNVREKIGGILNITALDRIQIEDLNCVDGKNKLTATVTLAPVKARRLWQRNTMHDKNSLDLFYIFRDTMPSNIKMRRLSANNDVGKSHFHVGTMRMELGLADTLKFKRNNTILSKENEIRSFAQKYKKTFVVVPEQKSAVDERMGLLLEKINEMHKQDLEIHEEDQRKMQLMQENAQALHEEDQFKMQLMQENAQALHEEDQLKMQLMQENSQALHEEEKRLLLQEVLNLRQQGELNMNRVVIEMSIIMMCCMIFAVAVLYRLRL